MATVILRPNADWVHNLYYYDGSEHEPDIHNWEQVDEAVSDDDSTYVFRNWDSYTTDIYNIEDTALSGVINSVTVYCLCRATTTPDQASLRMKCRTHANMYTSDYLTLTTSYALYSKQWTTNPNTLQPWTWAEINAVGDFGAAVEMRSPVAGSSAYNSRCTQVYVEVDYTHYVGSGSITPTGALGRKTSISIGAGSITPSGVLGRLIKIAVGSGVITPTGALGRKIKLAVGQGSIVIVGALNRLTKLTVGAGAITIAGSLSTIKRFLQSVGGGSVAIVGLLSLLVYRLRQIGDFTGRNISDDKDDFRDIKKP